MNENWEWRRGNWRLAESLRGEISVTEKVVDKTDHCWISKNWHLHMTEVFIRRRDIASCPWTIWKFGNIWENAIQLCLMTESSEVQSISHQHSAMLIVPLFSPKNPLQKVARLWKHRWRRFFFDNLKKPLVEVSFHFHLQLCRNILQWQLSYEVTSCNL